MMREKLEELRKIADFIGDEATPDAVTIEAERRLRAIINAILAAEPDPSLRDAVENEIFQMMAGYWTQDTMDILKPALADRICAMFEGEGGLRAADAEDLESDAQTLRGYIKTHGETPAMTWSNREHWKKRAERAEADIEKLKMDAEHLQYERDEAREKLAAMEADVDSLGDLPSSWPTNEAESEALSRKKKELVVRSVKRYSSGGSLRQEHDGTYVNYTDYEALESYCTGLEGVNDILRDKLSAVDYAAVVDHDFTGSDGGPLPSKSKRGEGRDE